MRRGVRNHHPTAASTQTSFRDWTPQKHITAHTSCLVDTDIPTANMTSYNDQGHASGHHHPVAATAPQQSRLFWTCCRCGSSNLWETTPSCPSTDYYGNVCNHAFREGECALWEYTPTYNSGSSSGAGSGSPPSRKGPKGRPSHRSRAARDSRTASA